MNLELGNHTYKELISEVNNKAVLLTENIEFTVGSGTETSTHFNTLGKALNKCLKYRSFNNFKIVVKLKSGFILNEKNIFSFCDFSHVEINSEDEEVMVHNNSGIFFTLHKCKDLKLNVLFNLQNVNQYDDTYHTTPFIYCSMSSLELSKGVKNAKNDVIVSWNSLISSSNCKFLNCTSPAIMHVWQSVVNVENCDFSGFTGKNLFNSITMSDVTLTGSKYDNCRPTGPLLNVGYFGRIVSLENSKIGFSGTATNITPNQFTDSGVIIYR